MFATLNIERVKLFRRLLFWVELGIVTAIVVLFLTLSFGLMMSGQMPQEAEAQLNQVVRWPAGMLMSGGMAASTGLGSILVVVLVGASVAQDYTWGTLALLLSHGVPRPVALLAKLTVLIAGMLIIAVAATLLGGALSALYTVIVSGDLPLQAADFEQALALIVKSVVSLLPYIGLTLLLAVMSRSTVAAIGGGIGVMVGESILSQLMMLFGGVLAKAAMLLPSMLGQQLMGGAGEIPMDLPLPLDPMSAALGLAAYGLIFTALALWRFQRQDLTV